MLYEFVLFIFAPQFYQMTKKLLVIDAAHVPKNDNTTTVWWKIGNYFIHQGNIRSVSRKGKHSVISLFHGEDITAKVDYDKLSILLPSDINAI